ncbi:hypothetical protein KKB43_06410 [Patescibacteria group bacterium]|nr:hypothetical protein [Patescibacteria group bacterium]MBU4580613.1 hypothetical protein [Patescibacteria group bacterium]
MNRNGIIRILLAAAIFCIIGTIAVQTVSATYETEYMIFSGQQKIITINPWPQEAAVVSYLPNAIGTRTFTAYHSWFSDPSAIGLVEFYWRNSSVPNDPWHYWDTKQFRFLWPNAKTTLYSGSRYIEFKFVVVQYGNVPMAVTINIS